MSRAECWDGHQLHTSVSAKLNAVSVVYMYLTAKIKTPCTFCHGYQFVKACLWRPACEELAYKGETPFQGSHNILDGSKHFRSRQNQYILLTPFHSKYKFSTIAQVRSACTDTIRQNFYMEQEMAVEMAYPAPPPFLHKQNWLNPVFFARARATFWSAMKWSFSNLFSLAFVAKKRRS